MIMKKLFCLLALIALGESSMAKAGTDETSTLDPEGYIRDWVMLAPIALPDGDTASDLLLREQIPAEATLKPRDGDKLTVRGKELVWKNVTAATNFFDFNAVLKSQNDHAGGFIVTYVECDQEISDVTMAVASNDEGRIYFNGVDIYAFTEARPLLLDSDKGRVTLKKGVNVIVFKILNEQNSWQGAMRLLDKGGTPLKNVKIRRSP